jgi:N4-gp56 family major capsid protein
MALTDIQTTHQLTQKKWSDMMFKEHVNEIYFRPYASDSMRSPVIMKRELTKTAGDKLSLPKLYLLEQDSGVTGSTTLEGKEQSLEYGDDILLAEETRNAVRFRLGMSTQRTSMNFRNDAREVLMEWKTQETDNATFAAASAAPSVNRVLAADSTHTHDASVPVAGIDDIATTDIVSVKGIRKLKLWAITGADGAAEKIKPWRDAQFGRQTFLLFLDPWSLQDLKLDPDYLPYAVEEGKGREKFFNGGITTIDGVIIVECDKVVREINAGSVTVARNLFMGSAALAINWAAGPLMDGQSGFMQWTEENFDYKNQIGIAVGDIKGIKKLAFNKEAEGTKDDNGIIQYYTASISG